MAIVIVRHFETVYFFVMMNMTERCPTFGVIFHLHFQAFKNTIKKKTLNFCKNKYFDGVHTINMQSTCFAKIHCGCFFNIF